jgi:hypothetical protein
LFFNALLTTARLNALAAFFHFGSEFVHPQKRVFCVIIVWGTV